ncbi:MAG: polyphosphate kinase 2 [Rhodobacteraceae bacterium]|nr:polyphosphate kinase 2 [Paracoccaceae bacterium]
MDLPFNGAITRYFKEEAPAPIRKAVEKGGAGFIPSASYPYAEAINKKDYASQMAVLRVELAKLEAHIRGNGTRIVVLFEGRDAAGKGGTIKAITEDLNPRTCAVIALPKPTERETGEWYFQRYVEQLPSAGEMTLFDRSWYNRGVVEKVFGFCTEHQREHFFSQLPSFEAMLVEEGLVLIKFWLSVDRAEQLQRFLDRENDPVKQWKLSQIDVDGLKKWDDYTAAINDTLARSHRPAAPWSVVLSDDKMRARIAVAQTILRRVDYHGKDTLAIGEPDPAICGGPDLLHG